MPFKKGLSGNPRGRKKGAANHTSEAVRKSLLKLLDDNLDKLQKDINSLEPKDRAALLIKLAHQVIPAPVNPAKLTEEQMEEIIDYLKKQQS